MSVLGGPRPSAMYIERQALTRSPATPTTPSGLNSNNAPYMAPMNAPVQGTTNPGDGLVLANVMTVVVSVYPWAGATLSGAGSLLCWVWDPYSLRWGRCSDLDLDLSDASGFPGKTFASFQNVSRLGMLINWLTSSVTASAGSDVLVELSGFQSYGQQAL